MPAPPGPLALVAYDGLRSFEYAIAAEVFALQREGLGVPWYDCIVVSPDRGPLRGVGGLAVRPDTPFDAIDRASTVVLPGWRDVECAPPRRLLQAVRAAHARGARLLSICTGSFVLAAAGLLDGRRATTHWLHAARFRARFPQVRLEADVLYVDEGQLITSAGSAAGLDACLHLVRRDHGARVANIVARRLVVPPHREGGQAQYVEAPVAAQPSRSLSPVLDWARARLNAPLAVSDLARRAAMSERSFQRHFSAAVGLAPNTWLQHERMARARALLERGRASLDDVAVQCGYESGETFRAAFRRVVGVSPAAYRARFGPPRRAGG